jgi:putative transposase
MSQSLSKIWTHLVYSTNERDPFLSDQTVRPQRHAYMARTQKENSCPTLTVGGVSDHVHAFISPLQKPFNRECCLGD